MASIKDMTEEELGHLVEAKLLEILGDPDSGLELREEFRQELLDRQENPAPRVSHKEVLKRFA